MKTLGLRHVALNVRNAQAAKDFYCKVLKMEVEWEPDPKTVYVRTLKDHIAGTPATTAADNIALHQADAPLHKPGSLNHLGFIMPTMPEVDAWYNHIKGCGAKIVKEIKTHRDGARSFYFEDLDGNIIQMLYHPPISG
jgi:catechol 2,3-dioxygenase-like lactoylglutathione lyase family enzyme